MRRSYTTARTQDDDDSVCVSTASSSSSSEETTKSSKNNAQEDVVKNTSSTETGKNKKAPKDEKLEKQMARWDDSNQSTIEEKINQFIKQLENHKDPKKNKKDLVEEFIRTNASESFMRKMTKISNKEIAHLKGNTAAKWASILASGVISQWTSFLVGSEAAIATKQAWIFPFLATICSEVFADKAAALVRRSTYTTNDAKNLYRKQRLIARAVGDAIRICGGLKPVAKYRTNNPEYKNKKFTAWEALWKDSDSIFGVSAHNLVNRGVPFFCFTGTYIARDFLLQTILKGGPGWQKSLLNLGSGAIAGGLTAITNQFLTSHNKDATENPGHSTSHWHAKENYLSSIRQDIRERLNEIGGLSDETLKNKIEKLLLDLDDKIQREIEVARLKKSKWTAIPGELKASAHRSRPEDSIDPEAPGTLAQSIHSASGKFISLIYFTYMLDQSMKNEDGTQSFSPWSPMNLIFLPFALILMGWMWRDDAQIFSRLVHGMAKAAQDITKGREQYKEKNTQELKDIVTEIPPETRDEVENDEGNIPDLDQERKYSKQESKIKPTAREQEAIDRRNEKNKQKIELKEKQSHAKNKSVRQGKMSGGEESDDTDEDSEASASSSSTSEKGGASSSTSNLTASASSTSTSDDGTSSSSEASSEPKRKKTS
jgi:hypothetical protein